MQLAVPFEESSPLRAVVLGSGSGGNAVLVESGGRRLLLDAGFSCRELERRMRLVGVEPATIDALVLTHEHEDHVRGADRFARRHGAAVYASAGTLAGCRLAPEVAARVERLESGRPVEVAGFVVEPFDIPHDAREPLGLVVTDSAGRRVGLVADLGCRSRLAWGRLVDLDLLLLETNHDLEMLRSGPYPWALKQRVAGRHGHLSNADAAAGLPELVGDRLRFVVPYHLSRTNNLSALAAAALAEQLDRLGAATEVVVAHQFEPTSWLEVNSVKARVTVYPRQGDSRSAGQGDPERAGASRFQGGPRGARRQELRARSRCRRRAGGGRSTRGDVREAPRQHGGRGLRDRAARGGCVVRCGVVVFPGSNCDHDVYHVLKHVLDQEVLFLWHDDTTLKGCELVVLPGGWSYGDYLRGGAMAALSPVMRRSRSMPSEADWCSASATASRC